MVHTEQSETASGSPQVKDPLVWDNAAIVKTFDAALRLYDDDAKEPTEGIEEVPWMHRPLTLDGTPSPPPAEDVASSFTGAEAEPLEDEAEREMSGGSGSNGAATSGAAGSGGFMPQFVPSSSSSVPALGEDKEMLTQMLLAWYNAGYQTGRYQALQELKSGHAKPEK